MSRISENKNELSAKASERLVLLQPIADLTSTFQRLKRDFEHRLL